MEDPSLVGGPTDSQDTIDDDCRPPIWKTRSEPPPLREQGFTCLIDIPSPKAVASSAITENVVLTESEPHSNNNNIPTGQICEEHSINSRKEILLQNRSYSMPEVENQSMSTTTSKSSRLRQALRLPSFKSLGIANPQPSSLLTPPDETSVDPLIASVVTPSTPANGQYGLTTAELSPADSPLLHDDTNTSLVTPTLSNRDERPPHIELSGPPDESMQTDQPPSTSSSSATESIGGPGWYDQTVETISTSNRLFQRQINIDIRQCRWYSQLSL